MLIVENEESEVYVTIEHHPQHHMNQLGNAQQNHHQGFVELTVS